MPPDADKPDVSPEPDILPQRRGHSLSRISHDGRDAELAEAFGKLLKSVSAGMIKTFRFVRQEGTRRYRFR